MHTHTYMLACRQAGKCGKKINNQFACTGVEKLVHVAVPLLFASSFVTMGLPFIKVMEPKRSGY